MKESSQEEIKIRPIGIGEIIRRITGKCIVKVLKGDIQKAGGLIQTCTGVPSGIEAAIQATRQAFEREDSQSLLLVDATNAFNSLNRQAAVHNLKKLCPPLPKEISAANLPI